VLHVAVGNAILNEASLGDHSIKTQPTGEGVFMSVELKPETERLVEEEIRKGHFHSVDELIVAGVYAWREKYSVQPSSKQPEPSKNLVDFFRESPLVGLELDLEREKDTSRNIDL
jgi:Arc/MetJ-type ribon-helix-helix transcriptional regulator